MIIGGSIMKEKTRICNEMDKLYTRFNDAIDSVSLPSEDELMQLLDKHDAQPAMRTPVVPVVPVSRRPHVWRYVAAAAVIVILAYLGWMMWPQNQPQLPIIAATTDSNNLQPQTSDSLTHQPLNFSNSKTLKTRTASVKRNRIIAPQSSTISDSNAENIIPAAIPDDPQTILSRPQNVVASKVAASETADSTAAAPQPNENDSIDTQQNQERSIEEYPVRPTIKETEDIFKDENNQRALRHRKATRRKNNNKREGNFIRKQSEKKDEIRTVSPPPTPTPIPRPHTTSLGNGKTQTIWY